jgi:hypothetical protein
VVELLGIDLIQKYDWSDYSIGKMLIFAASGVVKCRLSSRE